MRPIRSALAALALTLAALPAWAIGPTEVEQALPGAQKTGEASYHMLGIHLFNAEAYAVGGFSWQRPFALTLTYYNGAQRCDVNWPGFRRTFFGIWLDGRDGRAAVLSAQLRGDA
jgi:hypothetical protein